MSTESSVDFVVSSSLNFVVTSCFCPPYELALASIFAVLILQTSQKWISRSETRVIFPLQEGQSISFRFDFMDSTSERHRISGQTYFPTFFVSVGFLHFGQRCSEINSPFSSSFSRLESFRIFSFIGFLIWLKRYCAIALGHSGKWSFVNSPETSGGNAANGMKMWKPFEPENLMP